MGMIYVAHGGAHPYRWMELDAMNPLDPGAELEEGDQ